MKENKTCLYCSKELQGRADKKYCDLHCKSAYQYKKTQEEPANFYNKVDKQLKNNRKILKEYNKGGKVTVRTESLLEQGFNPKFFTHFWKNTKGDLYLFVYEYGFLKRKENNKEKFILVLWQPFMEN